jgi:hypothetical protein
MNAKYGVVVLASALTLWAVPAPLAQINGPEEPAMQIFAGGYPTTEASQRLKDELLFQNAVQTYLWALPALNMYGMKEGSEKVFGKGDNVLPVWKQRLNAKTLITTPHSDVIYAMGYLDLSEDGPLVIEVPPQLQGILDDFWQRPICSEGEIDGRVWCGDVGLPGPDHGKGGKYLLLAPDYKGSPPSGYYTMRSRTYGVFVFWRGFFKDPKDLAPPVENIQRARIYPLGKQDSAKPMQFPDASNVPANMLFPTDGAAFDMLARFIDHEYVDPADMWMRGIAASLGIVKGKPFAPDTGLRATLDRAARVAFGMSRAVDYGPGAAFTKFYQDRQWLNAFPGGSPWFTAPTFDQALLRTAFFSFAYSTSPGMAVSMVDVGAKYPFAFTDAEGKFLSGANAYRLHLRSGIPAKLFWSVTVYDALTASGLDNGQPFPSINQMDKPATNADGSTDFYFGPTSPGEGKNWLRTVADRGFFVILRLYGPTEPFFDQTWRPGDLEEIK